MKGIDYIVHTLGKTTNSLFSSFRTIYLISINDYFLLYKNSFYSCLICGGSEATNVQVVPYPCTYVPQYPKFFNPCRVDLSSFKFHFANQFLKSIQVGRYAF